MDITKVAKAKDDARAAEDRARQLVADAQASYGRAVQDLVDEHGATAVARELGITRARVYQLAAKAARHDSR